MPTTTIHNGRAVNVCTDIQAMVLDRCHGGVQQSEIIAEVMDTFGVEDSAVRITIRRLTLRGWLAKRPTGVGLHQIVTITDAGRRARDIHREVRGDAAAWRQSNG